MENGKSLTGRYMMSLLTRIIKNRYFWLILCGSTVQLVIAQQSGVTNLTATQVLDKVVKYYDPYDIWPAYKGEIHLYTILPNGNLKSEDIYLDNAAEVYQSVSYQGDSIILRKWTENQISYALNNRTNLSSSVREQLELTNRDIRLLKSRHQTEIGWPMQIKALNLRLNPIIKDTIFNNKSCLVLQTVGIRDSLKAQYPLLQQSIFFYINPIDFSLEGMEVPYEIKEYNIPGFRIIFNQYIEINDIKIPRVKTYYQTKDNKYYFTTTAHPFTIQPFFDEVAEKKAINKTLSDETYFFRIRDFDKWAQTWSHQPDVFHCFASKNSYSRNEGWINLKNHMQALFEEFPNPVANPIIKRNNYDYNIRGNIAWVYFDSEEDGSHGRQQRILRKENGEWKLISASGIDESSY